MEPGDGGGGVGVAGLDEVRVVGAATERNDDLVVADVDGGAGFDELAEQAGGLGGAEAFADAGGENAVQGAGHDGELDVEIDAQGHGGGQRIHVEEVDGIGDGVLDQHAAGIAVDQLARGGAELVGEQQGGLVVAEVADGDLADGDGIVLDADGLVEDAGGAVTAADVGEVDGAPAVAGQGEQLLDHLGAAAAQGEEGDAAGLEPGQVGIGGEAAVEDQFGGRVAGAGGPGVDEAQDLVVLGGLGGPGAGPGEGARVGVAGEEAEDGLLAAGALGDIVFFDEGVVTVVGDGVEVEVEGAAGAEGAVEGAEGVVPALGEGVEQAGVAAAGVLGEGGALGDGVEAGEQGDALVEHGGHDAGGAADAPELESEQGAQGAAGGDVLGAGQGVGEAVDVEPGQVGGEQEQAAEVGAEAPGSEIEGAAVGVGSQQDDGALLGPAAGQLGQAGRVQDLVDEADAGGQAVVAELGGDVVDG